VRALGNNEEQIIVAPCLFFFMSFPIIQLALFSTSYIPLGSLVEAPKNTTSSSRLDVREVVVGAVSKHRKKPPPARAWTQGRWEACRKNEINHLWLTFGHEEGGGGGRHVETTKKKPPPACV